MRISSFASKVAAAIIVTLCLMAMSAYAGPTQPRAEDRIILKPMKGDDILAPTPYRNSDETSIIFENLLGKDVDVYWVDWEGNPKHYMTLEPGQEEPQKTYAGHRWLVRLANSPRTVLGVYKAVKHPGMVIIE